MEKARVCLYKDEKFVLAIRKALPYTDFEVVESGG